MKSVIIAVNYAGAVVWAAYAANAETITWSIVSVCSGAVCLWVATSIQIHAAREERRPQNDPA